MGNGNYQKMCKSIVVRSPVPQFALPVDQKMVSKHWRHTKHKFQMLQQQLWLKCYYFYQ